MPFQVNLKPVLINTYPLLARSKQNDYGHIVLFIDKKRALIVDAGAASHYSDRVGTVAEFVSHTDTAVWEILPKGTTVTYTQG